MSLFDLQIPFFIPVWRRVVLVAFCLLWATFEFVSGAPFWGVLFGGMGLLAVWQLFLSGWPGSVSESTIESSAESDSSSESEPPAQ